ncbi:helix-turn-helix domain-containing protein [Desulfococcaceae bacterium HSG8]|nr:helix-turn-helix domain-containing protein [Desulfococcaceae bacterium HSG8]
MARITFIAYDRCMFSGIAGLIDAFTIADLWHQKFESDEASDAHPLFDTEIVSLKGKPVLTNRGIRINPDRGTEDVEDTDMILIPPYLFGVRPLPDEMPDILHWITRHYRQDTRIGALCTGVFILAMTGLLDGKIATTNWQVAKRFRRQFPEVRLKSERVLTEDSGLICSGAVTALYNLAIYVIEIFGSEALSRVCAKAFLVDPGRNTQAPYMITNFWKNHGDREILKAQEWMEDHYADNITIDAAARHVSLSPRHFKRRFKKATDETPLAYLQQIRLEAAKKRLETTTDNIDEITRQIGYEDSSSFRRLFKKYTALSPREYRDKFGNIRNIH